MMRSIALFPCPYTDGAMIIGELSTALRLKVYTDEMLFADISDRFGVPKKTLRRMFFGTAQSRNGKPFEKEIFVDLARRTLAAQRKLFSGRRMFFGLHTALLDPQLARVLKVLVYDDEGRRIKRAMRQEGFSRIVAREVVRQHDRKASALTHFLFDKEPYDFSLHDVVIVHGTRDTLEVTRQIIQHYNDIESWFTHIQGTPPYAVADNYNKLCFGAGSIGSSVHRSQGFENTSG
ncbi:MAG: cytidylate kinase family protein [Pseudomonadota bacterium]